MSVERAREILGRVCRVVHESAPRVTIGTGVLVGEDLVATCWHVIEGDPKGAYRVVFDVPDDRDWANAVEISATVLPVMSDLTVDAALLRIAEPVGAADRRGCEPLPASQGDVTDAKGSLIHVVGYPLGLALRHTVGTVLSAYDENYTVAHDAFTLRGNSGSPVFDSSLRLIGLHFYGQRDQGSQMAAAWALPYIFQDHLSAAPALAADPVTADEARAFFEGAGLAYPYLRDRAVCDVVVVHSDPLPDPLGALNLLWGNVPHESIRNALRVGARTLPARALGAAELDPVTAGLLESAGVIVLFRQDGDTAGFDAVAEKLDIQPNRRSVTALVTNAASGGGAARLGYWRELSLLRPEDLNFAGSALTRILRAAQAAEFTPRDGPAPPESDLHPVFVAIGSDWTAAEWKTYDYLLNELEREKIPVAPCSPFARMDNPAVLTTDHLVIAIVRQGSALPEFPDHPKERLLLWENCQTAKPRFEAAIPDAHTIRSEADFIAEALQRAKSNRRASARPQKRVALVVYNNADEQNFNQTIKPVLDKRSTLQVRSAWNRVNPAFNAPDVLISRSNECVFTIGSDLDETQLMFIYVYEKMQETNPQYRGYACFLGGTREWVLDQRNWTVAETITAFEQIY